MEDGTSTPPGAAARETPEELGGADAAPEVAVREAAEREEAGAEARTEPASEIRADEKEATTRDQHGHRIPPGEVPRWLDIHANVKKVLRVFWGVCALVLLIDLLALLGLGYDKDPHFDAERLPGFYGLYGFAACVALVLLATLPRRAVTRRDDYYDE